MRESRGAGEPTVPDFRPRIERPKRAGGDGVPEVYCADEQDAAPVDVARWRALAVDALLHEGVRGACELSLFFIDETSIAELNLEHMGKTGPTDVLSFPMDGLDVMVESQGPGALTRGPARPHPDVDDVPTMLGDVLVCPSVAMNQFPSHAGTYDDEIALLVVHGVLHVLGFDHDDEPSTADMRSRELSILEKHHWNGPAPAGFRQGHDE
ncbi:MAG: rRNA maturation RNase YbeY [Actinobacteria bacterium]|nr:rRNA maturation RNase YbeY [Actinomycetota bacterium]